MLSIDTSALAAELELFEGKRLSVYDGTIIGIGHNLAYPVRINDVVYDTTTETITDDECQNLLDYDINDVMERIERSIGWIDTKSELQRRALVHIGFNMGVPRLLKFQHMLTAVKDNNVRSTIAEAIDSKWYHQISPHRSAHVILQLCDEVPVGDATSQLTALWECAPLV